MNLLKRAILGLFFTGIGQMSAFAQFGTTYYGLYAGKNGTYNTHIGHYAGNYTTGGRNTSIGYASGQKSQIGIDNTNIGSMSGHNNTYGKENTFVGTYAGYSQVRGDYNTFVGHSSGFTANNAYRNTFLGYFSGRFNTFGSRNVFVGNYSGIHNEGGEFNTFVGSNSGQANKIGHGNVSVGFESGFSNVEGNYNVFIGYKAGYKEKGSEKLYIANKDDENPLMYGDFANNVVSIGTKYTGTAYKLVVPGATRASRYDVVSDERLKEKIHGLSNALEKIQQVEGVSYVYKYDSLARNVLAMGEQRNNTVQFGFLAQNIQKVFPELVTEDQGLLAVNYQGMIPVLVEALKSLTAEKEGLAAVNSQMEEQLEKISRQMDELEKSAPSEPTTSDEQNYQLEQNHPNPFGKNTYIRYRVPVKAKQVELLITSTQGIDVKRFVNLPAGEGQFEISSESLPAGSYIYSLFADGVKIGSNKMLLTK